MSSKPIAEVQYHGKRVRVDFALQQKGFTIRYDVVVDDEPVLSTVFAEEVIRWLADAMHEQVVKAPTTRLCSMEDARRCRDAQNVDCQFPQCQIRNDNVSPS